MYSEIIRIIEGGLNNDRRKIVSYSNRLASHLEKDGEKALSASILSTLKKQNTQLSTMDSMNIPVDIESRLRIVDIIPSDSTITKIVLSPLVKKEITNFISLVNNNDKLEQFNIPIAKNLLLYGKPGCGKTSIAHYISEHTHLPLVIARLDAIVSSLLGNTAKNIRRIFDFAQQQPCILFLDEFDAIAKARDDNHELGELKRVINSLLQNIDTLPTSCVLIAATNHPQLLDAAIWRRFETSIEVSLPAEEQYEELLNICLNGFLTDFSDDTKRKAEIIKCLVGISPSDVKNIINKIKAQSVIEGSNKLSAIKLLIAAYNFKNKESDLDGLVNFLQAKGMVQKDICQELNLSIRQIRNIRSKK
ncbi:ATPase [Segatella asaccharophila]|jgi:AAA+ superfamily predicted ATPase